MDSSQYGSSDVDWKRLDPRTVELTNRPPQGAAIVGGESPAQGAMAAIAREAQSKGMSMDEFANYDKGMSQRERQRPGLEGPAEKPKSESQQKREDMKQYRRQFRVFKRALKGGDPTYVSHLVNRMMDTGALSVTPEGDVYSALPSHPGITKDQVVDAVRQWHNYKNEQGQRFDALTGTVRAEEQQAQWEKRQVAISPEEQQIRQGLDPRSGMPIINAPFEPPEWKSQDPRQGG